MKALCLTMAFSAFAIATPALAKDAAVEAPITKFVESFNRGDIAAATTTVATDVQIIDEFAPYSWNGPTAFQAWMTAYEKDATAKGLTDPMVALGAPTREMVSGTRAYVIVPAVYTYKQKGVAMTETAQMTVTLANGDAGWKIIAWTWTGPDPSPAH